MDRAYVDSIVKVVLESNMTERNIKTVELRPITCSIKNGGKIHTTAEICSSDTVFADRAKLSEAWIAGNLLLFTIFDGYLENKYGLIEGASFRNHYQNLPASSDVETIQKDCYRIMKLIRNAAQHNLSSIVHDNGGYNINYTFNRTNYRLKISKNGLDCLYTIIINLVQEKIKGLCKAFHTIGHFDGIMRKLHEELCSEIDYMDDEDGSRTNVILPGIKLECVVRCPVKNPIVIDECGKLIFRHIVNKAFVDENNVTHYYPTDYVYKCYVLPQELGTIITNFENKGYDAIEFEMPCLCNSWKVGI